MTNYQASCGHTIEYGTQRTVAIKSLTREWNNSIDYKSVCPICFSRYEAEGSILHTDGDERRWLNEKG